MESIFLRVLLLSVASVKYPLNLKAFVGFVYPWFFLLWSKGVPEQLENASSEVGSARLPTSLVNEQQLVYEYAEIKFAQDVRGLARGLQGEMRHHLKLTLL